MLRGYRLLVLTSKELTHASLSGSCLQIQSHMDRQGCICVALAPCLGMSMRQRGRNNAFPSLCTCLVLLHKNWPFGNGKHRWSASLQVGRCDEKRNWYGAAWELLLLSHRDSLPARSPQKSSPPARCTVCLCLEKTFSSEYKGH